MSHQDTSSVGLQRNQTGRGRGLKFIPALAAFILIGLSLYASQSSPLQPVKEPNAVGRATGSEQQGDKNLALAAKTVAAAKAFLDSLDAPQRAKAALEYDDAKKKTGWSNLPITAVPRNGVRMGDLNKAQRDAAMAVVAATLSPEGYQKAIDIMNGDEMLAKGGGGKGDKGKGGKDKGDKGDKGKGDKGGKDKGGKGGGNMFGNDNYFLTIFGTPSVTQPWMVQFGGHHLGINVTLVGKSYVLTPTHTGAQPATFSRDGKTVRPLGAENDAGFKLINALDANQRAKAIIGANPTNLVWGPPGGKGAVKDVKIDPIGVKGSDLNAAQQAMLLDIISQWVNIVPDESAAARMAEIKANVPETYFAWSGPTAPGSAAYFRVTGPTLVIEYAPQGGVDHIHTIIHDPSNEYGQKLTKK